MQQKQNTVTLVSIGRLISNNNKQLAKMMDEKLARNNVAVFGEMDKIHNEIARLGSETIEEFSVMKGQFEKFRKEMNQRFDFVDDQLQNVLGAAGEYTERKIAEMQKRVFAS